MEYYDKNIVNETDPSVRKNYTESLTLIPKGYTARGTINGFPVMMTSCSLSYDTNVVKGSGVMPVYQNRRFRRIQGNAFRDYPIQTLSVSCDATEGIFTSLILPGYRNSFMKEFDVRIEDSANNIEYRFQKAWATKCSFSVSTEEAVEVSFDFNIYRDGFLIESGRRRLDDYAYPDTERFVENLVGNSLLGYYHFGVQYSGFRDQPLTSFSIDFSRDISPKFGCVGASLSTVSAIAPMKLIFGLPQVAYSLTYLMVDDMSNDDYREGRLFSSFNESNEIVLDPGDDEGKTLEIHFIDQQLLEFTNCYPNSYSPQVGSKEDAPRLEISGEVYGQMRVGGI